MASYYKTNAPTPAGGDYSEIYFVDEHYNAVDETKAVRCIIRECKKDGTLINEIFGMCDPSRINKEAL